MVFNLFWRVSKRPTRIWMERFGKLEEKVQEVKLLKPTTNYNLTQYSEKQF